MMRYSYVRCSFIGWRDKSRLIYSIHEIRGICLQLVALEKCCPSRIRSAGAPPFAAQTTGPDAVVERGTLRAKKSGKKGVSCFVYAYEERNEALPTLHTRSYKSVAPSLLENVIFPRMEDCLMSTAIFRTRIGQAIAVSAVCDGGDQGCGAGLLLLLLQAAKRLDPGTVLELLSPTPT